jgi:hypothetical protein
MFIPGDNIIDDLVPTIDEVRADIHAIVGDRQYVVTVVTRAWPSGRIGDRSGGQPVVGELVLAPPPRVEFVAGPDKVEFELRGGGREENGGVVLTEISLSYTEDQLCPRRLPENTEVFYRITDALGNAVRMRHFVPSAPPRTDREKDIGWKVKLTRYQVQE